MPSIVLRCWSVNPVWAYGILGCGQPSAGTTAISQSWRCRRWRWRTSDFEAGKDGKSLEKQFSRLAKRNRCTILMNMIEHVWTCCIKDIKVYASAESEDGGSKATLAEWCWMHPVNRAECIIFPNAPQCPTAPTEMEPGQRDLVAFVRIIAAQFALRPKIVWERKIDHNLLEQRWLQGGTRCQWDTMRSMMVHVNAIAVFHFFLMGLDAKVCHARSS